MAGTDLASQLFSAEVRTVETLSPAMRRVVFGGAGLADYKSTGVGDEYVRILFPDDPDRIQEVPAQLDPELVDLERLRTYTVRAHDLEAGTLTIDFVVHEGGVAAQWALQAKPGQQVLLNGPECLYSPPPDLQWQLLVADYAGAPAAIRLAEETTAATRLVIEIAADDHRLDVAARDGLEVLWVVGGNGHGPSRLEEIVRSLVRPEGTGYVWVAGESRTLRGIRKHLRHELRLPATAYKSVGYWIENGERWREQYDALDPETRAQLEAMWDQPRDEEEIEDEYEDRLTELGL